jgi:hypothetical protein
LAIERHASSTCSQWYRSTIRTYGTVNRAKPTSAQNAIGTGINTTQTTGSTPAMKRKPTNRNASAGASRSSNAMFVLSSRGSHHGRAVP